MPVILLIKLIDLALAGGQYAIIAKQNRDKLEAAHKRGGPTKAELREIEALCDEALAALQAEHHSQR